MAATIFDRLTLSELKEKLKETSSDDPHYSDIQTAIKNKKGLVDCVYRRFNMPVEAVIEKFGIENVSRETQNIFKKSPFEDIDLVHVVKPRSVFDLSLIHI